MKELGAQRTLPWVQGRICGRGRRRLCCRAPRSAAPPPTSPSHQDHICNQITVFSLTLFCEKRCVELDRTVRFNYPWDLSAAGQDAALTSTPPNLNPPTGLKWPGLARQLVAKTEIGLIPPWFTGPEGHPCQSLKATKCFCNSGNVQMFGSFTVQQPGCKVESSFSAVSNLHSSLWSTQLHFTAVLQFQPNFSSAN